MTEIADLLVLGSGPAGIAAATAYRTAGGQGSVVVLSADIDEPYERPPLTKEVLRGEQPAEPTPLATPKQLADVDLRLGARVTGLDVDAKTVRLGEDAIGYRQLVIATGSRPIELDVAEPDAPVATLRSLEDAQRLVEQAEHARSAVVIGSGFIGTETAASLAKRGLEVTLVTTEEAPQAERLGAHAARTIVGWLEELGVRLVAGVEVTSVEATREVHLSNGETVRPDLILAAIGVEPASEFLERSGLQMHEGRVVVDERMRADDEGTIRVAGDLARAHHAVAGRALAVEHWGDAERMGEIAGKDAAKPDAEGEEAAVWDQPPGFWTVIGDHELKLAAWGDGWDEHEVVERPGGFVVWYGRDGQLAGALAYNADADYERAAEHLGAVSFADAVRGQWPGAAGDDGAEAADEEADGS